MNDPRRPGTGRLYLWLFDALIGFSAAALIGGCAGGPRYYQQMPTTPRERVVYYERMVRNLGQTFVPDRDAARRDVLREQIAAVTAARAGGDPEAAAVKLEDFFAQRDAWGQPLEPATQAAAAREATASGAYLQRAIIDHVRERETLPGDQFTKTYLALVDRPELATSRDAIRAHARAEGLATCHRLAPAATTPYLTWAIAAYCAHWGDDRLTVPPLPNQLAGLTVEGTVAGEDAAEVARLRDAIAAAFRATAWYAPGATRVAHATVDGSIAITTTTTPVTRSKQWSERIPYTAYETTEVAYEEPYEQQQTYEVTRDGVTEQRTRTVIRRRVAYRPESHQVTRFRDEPRLFTYQAMETVQHHRATFRVQLDRGLPPATVDLTDELERRGDTHDLAFAAAGVAPERFGQTTLGVLATVEEARIAAAVRSQLEAHYRSQHCDRPAFSAEDAAACAYLDPAAMPEAAHQALRALFGDDELLLRVLLVRPADR